MIDAGFGLVPQTTWNQKHGATALVLRILICQPSLVLLQYLLLALLHANWNVPLNVIMVTVTVDQRNVSVIQDLLVLLVPSIFARLLAVDLTEYVQLLIWGVI
jgi:hypothetical protein